MFGDSLVVKKIWLIRPSPARDRCLTGIRRSVILAGIGKPDSGPTFASVQLVSLCELSGPPLASRAIACLPLSSLLFYSSLSDLYRRLFLPSPSFRTPPRQPFVPMEYRCPFSISKTCSLSNRIIRGPFLLLMNIYDRLGKAI